MIDNPRTLLRAMFDAAVAAADPAAVVAAAVPTPPKGRTIVVGAGKASAAMAAALEAAWPTALSGLVVTRDGHTVPCRSIEVVEAAHPVPDVRGAAAAERMLRLVQGLTAEDLLIALISGGGSALLPLPPAGVSLDDKRALNEALLASGAPITALNCVRKHVSRIKGGRLAAAAYPARVATLVVSDIPGDDPALVASGPTVPDASDRAQALAIVERYGLDLPPSIRAHLASPAADAPRPDDLCFASNSVRLLASAGQSLRAAAAVARQAGASTVILSDAIEGEARNVGTLHGTLARRQAGGGHDRPLVILSGGETTVTLQAASRAQKAVGCGAGRRATGGRGGRNQEFLLALAIAIDGVPGVTALAADTDGIDGSEPVAGAFADGSTAQRLRDSGLSAATLLEQNDSFAAFAALHDHLVTGPTRTNVNDFRAILVMP